ncbi:MAG: response regulator [Lentisphaerae bacterium]|jgi:CheY-like chemotaxis protein|nr:response regulator [Lentisphaerota bacterium]MBT4822874.1 response regulator [Lentisphaerota bacterium]MBT5605130.1 response regulator [Lentisphaerota bacterium]MBT7059858.1 response regulator [Lentisphaerota bacterium]MBT7848321.1 response regulator [Lentisphaerota bacterium]
MPSSQNKRILIVDDSADIHDDFAKILSPESESTERLAAAMTDLFGAEGDPDSSDVDDELNYVLSHAHQGEEAYRMVREAALKGEPFALAFVDVRMPPGWDGIRTIGAIWEDFPDTEMVICTAYSDYSWKQILDKIGVSDKLQFLRKPFDVVSVKQMALALTTKWDLGKELKRHIEGLEAAVSERTKELSTKVSELEEALGEIQQLRGILPMCVYCHKVRDDDDFWQQVDSYIQSHTQADVSHGICPECFDKHVQPMLEEHEREVAEKKAD